MRPSELSLVVDLPAASAASPFRSCPVKTALGRARLQVRGARSVFEGAGGPTAAESLEALFPLTHLFLQNAATPE